MAIEAPTVSHSKANERLDAVMDGVPPEIRKSLLDAAALYAQENDPGAGIDERTKAGKLRAAYNGLSDFLIKERLNALNPAQFSFLCSGAIADKVTITPEEGEPYEVQLLDTAVYDGLVNVFKKPVEGPAWTKKVWHAIDKFKAIARGNLLYLDPTRKKTAKKEESKDLTEQIAALQMKMRVLARDSAPLLEAAEPEFAKFMAYRNFEQIKAVKENLDALKTLLTLAANKDLSSEEESHKMAAEAKASGAPTVLIQFGAKLEEIGKALRASLEGIDPKLKEYFRIKNTLGQIDGGAAKGSSEGAVVFDDERVGWVRRDIDALNGMIVRGSDTAPTRIPWSPARILLDVHSERVTDPLNNAYCTPHAAVKALEKIMSIHVNLFPRDPEGNPQVLPVTIEVIRNYVECLEDRFVLSFVSGEQERKGPKVSFTPVEMQVIRACGMYVAKDPVYDFRGQPNVGTFMGEYAGKIEKSAQVKWTGEDKKFTIVSAAETKDKAGREEAVADYMDFIYCIVNDLNPPHKLSKRKIAVILRYCVIVDAEKSAALLLRYVAQQEPEEAKESLLKIASNSLTLSQPTLQQNNQAKRDEAKRLILAAYKKDPNVAQIMGDNIQQTVVRLLGKDDPPPPGKR